MITAGTKFEAIGELHIYRTPACPNCREPNPRTLPQCPSCGADQPPTTDHQVVEAVVISRNTSTLGRLVTLLRRLWSW